MPRGQQGDARQPQPIQIMTKRRETNVSTQTGTQVPATKNTGATDTSNPRTSSKKLIRADAIGQALAPLKLDMREVSMDDEVSMNEECASVNVMNTGQCVESSRSHSVGVYVSESDVRSVVEGSGCGENHP